MGNSARVNALEWLPSSRKTRFTFVGVIVLAVVALAGWRPAYVAWKLHAARSALGQGRIEVAIQALRSAEHFEPERAETLYLLGRACRRAGDLEEAKSYLGRAGKAGWPESDLRAQQHLMLMQTGRFDRADSDLQRMLENGVEDWLAEEVYEARAKGYLTTYRLSDALLCLNYWIEWRSQAVQPRMWRADLWERIKRWEAACEDYRAVLTSDRSHLPARKRLAECLLQLNRAGEALDEFCLCLQTDPDDEDALIGAATCRRRLGRVADARRDLKAALRGELTAPQRAAALVELAQIALDEKAPSEAIRLLTEASRLDPRNTVAQHLLGTAYFRLGQADRAQRHIARAQQTTERFNRFSEITEKLLDTPQSAELRWEAGNILMEEGMMRDGAAWMATALVYDPYHIKTHETLAEYYAEFGEERLAARHHAMAENAREEPMNASQARSDGTSRLARQPDL